MVLQVWRHRPSGKHYVVYVENGLVVGAKGPMTAKQAVDMTQQGFASNESDPATVSSLNQASAEYEPIWESDRGDYSYDAWLAHEIVSGEPPE